MTKCITCKANLTDSLDNWLYCPWCKRYIFTQTFMTSFSLTEFELGFKDAVESHKREYKQKLIYKIKQWIEKNEQS